MKYILSCFIIFLTLATFAQCKNDDELTNEVEKPDDKILDKTYFPENVLPVLDELQEKTFRYFWDTNTNAGIVAGPELAAEGSQRHNVVTIGGAGFGIMATIVGVERGWITRSEAVTRLRKNVDWLSNTAVRFGGVWPHWLNPQTGEDALFNATSGGVKKPSGDLVESCFMLSGLLMAREYFNDESTDEIYIRQKINELYDAVDWKLYTNGKDQLNWIYFPENELGEEEYTLPIKGWNEAWICYILALGAPNTNVDVSIYNGWTSNLSKPENPFGYTLNLKPSLGGPMFLSHYSLLGLDPKKLEDQYTNYWYHAVNHSMVNRHHCVHEAPNNYKYSEGTWGLTACYGGDLGYSAREPNHGKDDGTIAPTAALGSYPYVPFYATQFMMNSIKNHSRINGQYGFYDAFRPKNNWYETRYLAIDQGPIVVNIENYRTGLFYDLLMGCPEIQKGLSVIGISKPNYKTGFHLAIPDIETEAYDAMMHPDTKEYEIGFYLEQELEVEFYIKDLKTAEIIQIKSKSKYPMGENTLSFKWEEGIWPGEKTTLFMKTDIGEHQLDIVFH